jgi:hypothetical protein
VPPPPAPGHFGQKKPNLPINIPKPGSQKKPSIFEELKPTKIDDPDPTPKPPQSPKRVLTGSDVQIKDPNDNNFFGNKNNGGGPNGINFMGSQIQSFNDIPTLNSKIPSFGKPKLPSINKFGGGPGGGMTSKIFNPNVTFFYFL